MERERSGGEGVFVFSLFGLLNADSRQTQVRNLACFRWVLGFSIPLFRVLRPCLSDSYSESWDKFWVFGGVGLFKIRICSFYMCTVFV